MIRLLGYVAALMLFITSYIGIYSVQESHFFTSIYLVMILIALYIGGRR